MLRTAIVGLGRWAQMRVTSVQGKSDDVRFTAAQTRTPAKVEEFCNDNSIELVGSYEEILANRDIDAVVLATPNSLHADQVAAAAAAGKHVFVEKPIALNLKDAAMAIEAVNKAGVTLGIGYQRRFYPTYQEIEARLEDGRLGTIASIIAEQSGFYNLFMESRDWRAQASEAPGGAMAAIGVHFVDAMIGLAGRVRQVHCVNERRASAIDDTTSVLLAFENGIAGELFCSMVTANYSRVAVYGSRGMAEITGFEGQSFKFFPVPETRPTGGHAIVEPETMDQGEFDAVAATTTAFARAALDGKPFPISIEDILHGVAVFDAIVGSGKTGKAVDVAGI